MWNLLCVMQVLSYSSNFVVWPAISASIIEQVTEVVYMTKVNEMIANLGKSKFQTAQSET